MREKPTVLVSVLTTIITKGYITHLQTRDACSEALLITPWCVFHGSRSSESRTDVRTSRSCFTDTQVRKDRSQGKLARPDRSLCLFASFLQHVHIWLFMQLNNHKIIRDEEMLWFFLSHSRREFSCKRGRRFLWRHPEKNSFCVQLCYLRTS